MKTLLALLAASALVALAAPAVADPGVTVVECPAPVYQDSEVEVSATPHVSATVGALGTCVHIEVV